MINIARTFREQLVSPTQAAKRRPEARAEAYRSKQEAEQQRISQVEYNEQVAAYEKEKADYEAQQAEYNRQVAQANAEKESYDRAVKHFEKGKGWAYLYYGEDEKAKEYIRRFYAQGYVSGMPSEFKPSEYLPKKEYRYVEQKATYTPEGVKVEKGKQKKMEIPEFTTIKTTEIPQKYQYDVKSVTLLKKPQPSFISSGLPKPFDTLIQTKKPERAISPSEVRDYVSKKFNKLVEKAIQYQPFKYIADIERKKIPYEQKRAKELEEKKRKADIEYYRKEEAKNKTFMDVLKFPDSITQKYFELTGAKFYKRGEKEAKYEDIQADIQKLQEATTPEEQEKYIESLRSKKVDIGYSYSPEGKGYVLDIGKALPSASATTQNIIQTTDYIAKLALFSPLMKTTAQQISELDYIYKENQKIQALQKKARIDIIKRYGVGKGYRSTILSKGIKRGTGEIIIGKSDSKILSRYLNDFKLGKTRQLTFKAYADGGIKEINLIGKAGKVRRIVYSTGRIIDKNIYSQSYIFRRIGKIRADKFTLKKILGGRTRELNIGSQTYKAFVTEQRLLANIKKISPIDSQRLLKTLFKIKKMPSESAIKTGYAFSGKSGITNISFQAIKVSKLIKKISTKTGRMTPEMQMIDRLTLQKGEGVPIKNVDDYQKFVNRFLKESRPKTPKIIRLKLPKKSTTLQELNQKIDEVSKLRLELSPEFKKYSPVFRKEIRKLKLSPTLQESTMKKATLKDVSLTSTVQSRILINKIIQKTIPDTVPKSVSRTIQASLSRQKIRSAILPVFKVKQITKPVQISQQKMRQAQRTQQIQRTLQQTQKISIPINMPQISIPNIITPTTTTGGFSYFPPVANLSKSSSKYYSLYKLQKGTNIFAELPDLTSRLIGLPREKIKMKDIEKRLRSLKTGFELRRGLKLIG